MKRIDSISFWKRDISSIEKTEEVLLTRKGSVFIDNQGKKHSKKEMDQLIHMLFDILKIEEEVPPYKAFLYENDKEDYSIKFFLTVPYQGATYLAIKGIHPFKQKNYKEILDLFAPYLN